MSDESNNLPSSRSWRDIPQPVRPRTMSREGKKRLAKQVFRGIAAVVTLSLGAWVAWQVAAVARNAKSSSLRSPQAERIGNHITLATDGVLDAQWLVRTLALPKEATLTSVDLDELKARILADGQVQSASLVRRFPATLAVRIGERSPVARLMSETSTGTQTELYVSREGIVYPGQGYDPAMVATLPWLDGVKLEKKGNGFAPIEGMEVVADLLARAKLETYDLYATWHVVSLAKLESDSQIEVRTREGLRVIFGTGPQQNYFRQLANLDVILDSLAQKSNGQAPAGEIDLSLGAEVPVHLGPPEVISDPGEASQASRLASASPAAETKTASVSPVSGFHFHFN